MTVDDAAHQLQVAPATIRQWVRRYDIPTVMIGRHLYIDRRALLECERDRRTDGRGRKRVALPTR